MASTDFRIARTGVNIADGFTNWSNPSRIIFNDGSGASVTLGPGGDANNLASGEHNVGIDLTSNIIGIEVKIDFLVNGFTAVSAFLTSDTSYTKISDPRLTSGTGEKTLGGPTDLWTGSFSSPGFTGFTATEVSTSTFGVAIHPVSQGSGATCTIDYVAVKLYLSDLSVVASIPMLGGASC